MEKFGKRRRGIFGAKDWQTMAMRYVKEVLIIFGMSFLGEVCRKLIPLPIPAGIYGMALLFVCLSAGLISLEDVASFGGFLLDILPLLFIPAGVELLGVWDEMTPMLLPALVITVATTVLVMVVSGRVTQWLMDLQRRGRRHGENAMDKEPQGTDKGRNRHVGGEKATEARE